jgi:TP901 family phage tail tape measure protein
VTAELAIIARLEGDASKGLQDIDKRLIGLEKSSGLASKGLAGLQKVGLAAAAGVGVAAAAVTAFAVSSAKDFLQFQDGMNEVFTLLPGITEDAMSAMSDSVLQTAQDIGRMPEEVIPALYQSLSAGVPQDNVFSFLEQAHMAALGGVTDLETAVDGITSVINAYGTDVIGAGEASDLMFTAVRLGKTTFGELAGSLSKVTPLASAMGIGFEDITAAMATMTSQGTPTAVATTQLSRLFQELGTAGTEVSDVFEEVAGESFLDFIEGGGNVADALKLVQEGADAAGMPMQDMFGSIQAGMAALQLSGKGMESFV